MKPTSIACVLTLLACFRSGSLARADLLVNEPFNYPTGSFSGANGGTGFSSGWSVGSGFSIAAGSLNAPAYQGTGNDVHFSVPSYSFQTMSRNLTTAYGATGTDLWVSYLTQPTSLNAFSALDFGLTFNQSLTVGILGGTSGLGPPSTTWGMDTVGGTGAVYSSVPVTYGQTTLLVVHVAFHNGPDQIDLYVNPGAVLPVAPDLSKTDLDLSFTQLGFGVDNGDVYYDELRMGTTYADVVPEPSALALLGLPAIILALRRTSKRVRVA